MLAFWTSPRLFKNKRESPKAVAVSSEFGEGNLAFEVVDMPDGKGLARLANTQAEI